MMYVNEHAPGENELQEKNGDLVCPADEQEQRAANGPWSEKDCPLVAQWLAANEKPLAAAIEASKETQYYLPDFRLDQETDKDLREAVFDTGGSVRYIAQALKARAMLRLHEEKINEAWDDLQACHRLSRLMGMGRKTIDLISAIVIDGFAYDGQCRIAHFAQLTPEQCAKFRADVQNLTPLPWYAKSSLSERFAALHMACSIAHGELPPGELNADDPETKTLRDRIAKWTDSGALEWNAVLHLLNEWFERLAAATMLPETLERRKAILQLDIELEAVRVATAKAVYSDETPPVPVASQQIASQIWKTIAGMPIALQERGERLFVNRQAAEIALVLSEYRTEHGRYPDWRSVL